MEESSPRSWAKSNASPEAESIPDLSTAALTCAAADTIRIVKINVIKEHFIQ
jgi:hypothetical protein